MWKREDRPHPVIAAAVVEAGRHPDERLAGAQLDHGRDLCRLTTDPAPAGERRGPGIAPGDDEAAAHRA